MNINLNIILLMVLFLPNCTQTLNWEGTELPCDENDGCLAGFSCLNNICIENGSLNIGDSCTKSPQCGFPDFCPKERQVCTQSCVGANGPSLNCTDGAQVCLAYQDENNLYKGGCTKIGNGENSLELKDCTSNTCEAGFVCVRLETTINSNTVEQKVCRPEALNATLGFCSQTTEYNQSPPNGPFVRAVSDADGVSYCSVVDDLSGVENGNGGDCDNVEPFVEFCMLGSTCNSQSKCQIIP